MLREPVSDDAFSDVLSDIVYVIVICNMEYVIVYVHIFRVKECSGDIKNVNSTETIIPAASKMAFIMPCLCYEYSVN